MSKISRIVDPIDESFVDETIQNRNEAFVLLDLIDAEFRSDPLSTQCFDRAIVDRVRQFVARNKSRDRGLGLKPEQES